MTKFFKKILYNDMGLIRIIGKPMLKRTIKKLYTHCG
jgi:hypothetical protein